MINLSKKKITLILIIFPAIVFYVGFLHFIKNIPHEIQDNSTKTDAIIVLTGGAHRVDLGYKLLQKGYGKKLFISGVYNGVKVQEIHPKFAQKNKLLQCCVILGYEAHSTRQNAIEVKNWLEAQNYTSFRLVTTDYHMQRSLFEIKSQLPDYDVIPHPVLNYKKNYTYWWKNYYLTLFLLKEYMKFIVSQLRVSFL